VLALSKKIGCEKEIKEDFHMNQIHFFKKIRCEKKNKFSYQKMSYPNKKSVKGKKIHIIEIKDCKC